MVVLIIAADRQVTIDVLCYLSYVYRVSAAHSAAIKGITAATAVICIPGGGGLTE